VGRIPRGIPIQESGKIDLWTKADAVRTYLGLEEGEQFIPDSFGDDPFFQSI
jgi:hypothetical protein